MNNRIFANAPGFGNQMQSMPNPSQILDNLMKDPQIAQNPRVQEVMRLRQNGDTKGLEKLGANICSQNGISYQEATGQFQHMMQGYGYKF